MIKICSCCKIEKSLTDFSVDNSKKDGLNIYCRDCTGIKYKEIKKKNPERIKEKDKRNYQTINGKYIGYKKDAKKRGIYFNLTKNEFESLWQKPCHYCDSPINTIGIDRKDNNIGYTPDNCLSCCRTCNLGKNNSTYEEYVEHCKRIARKWAEAI